MMNAAKRGQDQIGVLLSKSQNRMGTLVDLEKQEESNEN